LDISNDVEGHTLVVPKNHSDNVLDASNEDLSHIMSTINKICNHFTSLGFTGFNILNNTGKDAEQSVMHLHFHIIPRKENDGYTVFPKLGKSNIDLQTIVDKLKLN
jgi:histidine triad (HIT) family protein